MRELTGELNEPAVRIGPQPEPRGGAPRAHDYTTERIVSIARWPTEGCASGGLPLAADSSLFEIEPGEVLKHFATELPIRWNDGSETRLRLAPTPMGNTCMVDSGWTLVERYDYLAYEEQDPALFGQPIELELSTADGRFQNRTGLPNLRSVRALDTSVQLCNCVYQYDTCVSFGSTRPAHEGSPSSDRRMARRALMQCKLQHGPR